MRGFALLIMFAGMVAFSAGCGRGEQRVSATETAAPELSFTSTSFDFGDVVEGEKVACGFVYSNQGGGDLLIHEASASCGCTVPSYSRKPLPPGEERRMEVVFDTSGRSGIQLKKIHIRSNAKNNPVELTISANIIPQ